MRSLTVSLSMGALLLAGIALAQTPQAPPAAGETAGGRGAQQRVLKHALAARPDPLTPWRAPNRPHLKFTDVMAAHAGQARWTQVVVQDDHFTAKYIQMAPGEKTKRLFYPDNEMFFVVQSGQMRVSVDGLEPFIAAKSMIVQVPPRTFFEMEVLGDAPALRYEVTHTAAMPVYAEAEKPDAIRGQRFVRIAFPAGTPPRLDAKQIYLDFDKDVVQGGGRAGRFIEAGSLIRGMTVPTPPDDDLGHWHTETAEFYYIIEGKMYYQVEGAPRFLAEQGDIIYVPVGHYHRSNFAGGGMATRLAVFPVGNINHLDPENPSRQAP